MQRFNVPMFLYFAGYLKFQCFRVNNDFKCFQVNCQCFLGFHSQIQLPESKNFPQLNAPHAAPMM
jgi:hypothetical protein